MTETMHDQFRDSLPADLREWLARPHHTEAVRDAFRVAVRAIPASNQGMFAKLYDAIHHVPDAWREFYQATLKRVRFTHMRLEQRLPLLPGEEIEPDFENYDGPGDLPGWARFVRDLPSDVEEWADKHNILSTLFNRVAREADRRRKEVYVSKAFYTNAPENYDQYVETVETFTIPPGAFGGTYRKVVFREPDERRLATSIKYQLGRYNSGFYPMFEEDPRKTRAEYDKGDR